MNPEQSLNDLNLPPHQRPIGKALARKLDALDALAEHALVPLEQLRPLLARLVLHPDGSWPADSPEARALHFITVAPLPSPLTLIQDWTPFLRMNEMERLTLCDGVDEAIMLMISTLPPGHKRKVLMCRVLIHRLTVSDVSQAVQALLLNAAVAPSPALLNTVKELAQPTQQTAAQRDAALRAALEQEFGLELPDAGESGS